MTLSKVKIFGERNTGTNFTEQFVKANFPALEVLHHPTTPDPQITVAFPAPFANVVQERLIDDMRAREFDQHFGWKHARTDAAQLRSVPLFQDTGFIFLVRNPFAWLTSTLRRPYSLFSAALMHGAEGDMDAFLSSPILTNLRDNLDDVVIPSPMRLWSLKTRAHRDCAVALGDRAIFMRYEDLITDVPGAARAIARWGFPMPTDLRVAARSTKGDGLSFQDYQARVRDYRPEKEFTSDQIQRILAGLDRALCAELGYEQN